MTGTRMTTVERRGDVIVLFDGSFHSNNLDALEDLMA